MRRRQRGHGKRGRKRKSCPFSYEYFVKQRLHLGKARQHTSPKGAKRQQTPSTDDAMRGRRNPPPQAHLPRRISERGKSEVTPRQNAAGAGPRWQRRQARRSRSDLVNGVRSRSTTFEQHHPRQVRPTGRSTTVYIRSSCTTASSFLWSAFPNCRSALNVDSCLLFRSTLY